MNNQDVFSIKYYDIIHCNNLMELILSFMLSHV